MELNELRSTVNVFNVISTPARARPVGTLGSTAQLYTVTNTSLQFTLLLDITQLVQIVGSAGGYLGT